MQEQRFERIELLAIVLEDVDIALPDELPRLRDDGDLGAHTLHGLEHVAGDENRARE